MSSARSRAILIVVITLILSVSLLGIGGLAPVALNLLHAFFAIGAVLGPRRQQSTTASST